MSSSRFRKTVASCRLSHRESRVRIGALASATSELNATSAPIDIAPVHHLMRAHQEEEDDGQQRDGVDQRRRSS